MAETNSTILNRIWLEGTNDFQQRIPEPTQGNIDAVIDALFDPMNRQYYNQFIDALVMRIGETYIHQHSFRNPLAVFKKSRMRYGSTMQEIIPKWIRAHAYRDDAEDVFKMARPDVAAWYHSQNRKDRYDITINYDELRTAFTEENGLNRLVASILDVPMNSDEYDEFLIMKQLIAYYYKHWGFFNVYTPPIDDETTAKGLLKNIRTYAGKLRFPSTLYNSGAIEDIPVFVKPDELVLIITPEVKASIDVDALAVLFNVDRAEINYRTIEIDEFPISGAQALLTTEDFFMCRDTVYENTSMYNPKTLGINYFLHHWGIYSVSPFVPAILFSTDPATQVGVVSETFTGLDSLVVFDPDDFGQPVTEVVTGKNYLIVAFPDGDVDPSGFGVTLKPGAARFELEINYRAPGADFPVPFDSIGTHADYAVYSPDEFPFDFVIGSLYVADDVPAGAIVTVHATPSYVNPSGATEPFATASASVTVVGD